MKIIKYINYAIYGLLFLALLSSLVELPITTNFYLITAVLLQTAINGRRIRKLAESMTNSGIAESTNKSSMEDSD